MCAPSVIAAALAGMNRRDALHFAAGVVAGVACVSCSNGTAAARDEPCAPNAGAPPVAPKRTISADTVLDLTHTLSPAFPIWPNNAPVKITNKSTFEKNGFYSNRTSANTTARTWTPRRTAPRTARPPSGYRSRRSSRRRW